MKREILLIAVYTQLGVIVREENEIIYICIQVSQLLFKIQDK